MRGRAAASALLGLSLCACTHKLNGPRPLPHSARALGLGEVIVESWPKPAPRVETHRDAVVDELFGVQVHDPYRWLEDGTNPDVKAWIDRQNQVTEHVLSGIPLRERLRVRLRELLTIGSMSLPSVRRTRAGALRLFYTRREGQDEQPILFVRDGLHGAERALIDPNQLSRGEDSVALDWYEPSQDGSLLAYGLSRGGSEDSTLCVRDVENGRDLGDVIDRTRYASLTWTPDNTGFFYSRYPAPGSVPPGEERLHRRIFEHRLGQAPDRDALVFGSELAATDFPGCELSPDGRWLVIAVSRGFSETVLYLADSRQKPLRFRRITPDGKHRYSVLARNDALYVMTDAGAPRYRIVAMDPLHPEPARWRELVPEHAEDAIRSFDVSADRLLVSYLHAGSSRLERFDTSGHALGALPLPALGTSDGFSSLADGPDAFFAFESFALAPAIQHVDVATGAVTPWDRVRSPIRDSDFRVDSRRARSKDGTEIVYHLVHRREVELGRTPRATLLYGYGGFNENIVPRFSRAVQAFLAAGGVYVQALLRGGGEFGEAWHRAGQRELKQNVFDDFIAVAEDLLANGISDREHLAIYGRSNGGLLVAASLTQRPDLFRAAVAGVPLTDMIRYPRFLIGRLWVSEYGSPDEEPTFRALFGYSPYHHVRPGTPYPAVLVTTAEGDTRVDPLHARKFVAELQAATSSRHPVLLRTERIGGHGAGTPVSKLVAELTDVYSFLFAELGLSGEFEGRSGGSAPDETSSATQPPSQPADLEVRAK